MLNITSTSAPSLVTCNESFSPCNPQQDHLFAVRPGVPLKDALNVASCTLHTILHAVRHAAVQRDDELLYGAVFQLEAVKAIVDSSERPMPANNETAAPKEPNTTGAVTLVSAVARLEAMLHEAQNLSTTESGQACAFNQGRATAFELALDALREVQS